MTIMKKISFIILALAASVLTSAAQDDYNILSEEDITAKEAASISAWAKKTSRGSLWIRIPWWAATGS